MILILTLNIIIASFLFLRLSELLCHVALPVTWPAAPAHSAQNVSLHNL